MTINVECDVTELHEGEENDGPLESTDLFLCGRGISLLVNATEKGTVTYSLTMDGQQVQQGYVRKPLRGCPLCSREHEADCDLAFSTCTCKGSPDPPVKAHP